MARRTYRERIESYLRRNPGASIAEAGGKRGPAGAMRAMRTAQSVSTYTSARDNQGRVKTITVVVTGKDGLDRSFRIKRGTPTAKKAQREANRKFDSRLKRLRRTIKDSGVDYQSYARKGKRSSLFDSMMEEDAA